MKRDNARHQFSQPADCLAKTRALIVRRGQGPVIVDLVFLAVARGNCGLVAVERLNGVPPTAARQQA